MPDNLCSLVLGDARLPIIKKLTTVLEKHFSSVTITSNVADEEMFRYEPEPALVIFTDTVKHGRDIPFKLRKQLPKVGFVVLFDRVEPEMEQRLRSVGSIFLGSYDTFFAYSQAIVEPLLSSPYS